MTLCTLSGIFLVSMNNIFPPTKEPAQTIYFIKTKNDKVTKAFKDVDWLKFGHDMMGSRGISKGEIVAAVESKL